MSAEALAEYDTYTAAGDGGSVSASWNISESPDSDLIWHIIDGETCPKLFGVGDGKQKEEDGNGGKDDGKDDDGKDDDGKDDDGNGSNSGSGVGEATVRENLPAPNGPDIPEPEIKEKDSTGGYSVELPELKPLNSLSVLGLFALGVSFFVVVRRKDEENEEDDSTV